ncbi:MAG: hypothetical protein AAF244_02750 [Pseudomonadota bacterium]
MTKKPLLIVFLAMFSLFVLSGCADTWNGVKKDWGVLTDKVSNATSSVQDSLSQPEERATVIMQDKLCPNVSIDPEMSRIVEFNDPAKTSDDQIVSKFKITDTNTICETDGEFVSMQIDLIFEGNVGPAAVRSGNDKVFFSYPYYVEVANAEGEELAKEVFAASATYNRGEEKKKMVETIKQNLPLEKGIAPYQIFVGFSLTEDQLAYNTAN